MVCLLATLAQPIRDKLAFLLCRPPDPIAHSDAALVLLRQANGVLCFTRVSLNDGVGVSWRVGRGARAVIALMSADAMGPALRFVRGAGQPMEKLPINSAHQSAFLLLIGTAHHRLAGPISRLFQRPLCLAEKKAAEQMVQWVMVYPVRKKTVVAAAQSPATTHGTSTWRR